MNQQENVSSYKHPSVAIIELNVKSSILEGIGNASGGNNEEGF